MPPRSSSPICERSLDLTVIGIGRRDIPQCSSKHFHMEAFSRTFSGGQRPRALLDEEALLVAHAVGGGAGPEFHLRKGADAESFQRVEWRAVRAAGFGGDAEAVARGGCGGGAAVAVDDEIGHGAAQIVEEAVTGLAEIGRASCRERV